MSKVVFTARIRRMTEGNIFRLFTPADGGTPIRLMGGTPILPDRGTPSFLMGVACWDWMGYHLRNRWGYTPVRTGRRYPTPIGTGWGYPLSELVGDTPPPLELDGGTPCQDWIGVAPTIGTGSPIGTGWGYSSSPPPIRKQSSRASTCYAAGGMPFVFTQEDFLVGDNFKQKK